MISRRRAMTLLTGTVAAVVAVSLLSACVPAAEPEPTPTAVFASEEEAFAAAEETFRAYNQASNDFRNGVDGDDPLDYLTGKALEEELATRNEIRKQHLTLAGDTSVISFEPSEADLDARPVKVSAMVCLDVSDTKVLSSDLQDVTSPDRATKVAFSVEVVATAADLMRISEAAIEGASC